MNIRIINFAVLLMFSNVVFSEQLAFRITGNISNLFDSGNLLAGSINLGDPFTAVLRYENTTLDTAPGDPKFGGYAHVPPTGTNGLIFTVNGITFSTDPASQLNVNVWNDRGPFTEGFVDTFGVNALEGLSPNLMFADISVFMNLQTVPFAFPDEINVLANDFLPSDFNITDWDPPNSFIDFQGSDSLGSDFSGRGLITDIQNITTTFTATGSDVIVEPDATDGSGNMLDTSPVTFEFQEVTDEGTTTVTVTSAGAPSPSSFKIGNPVTYYELTTTATFEGIVEICLDYSNVSYGTESGLTLMHFNGSTWEDITTSKDTINNIICGSTTSFSTFAVFQPSDPRELVLGLITDVVALNLQKGITNSLDAKLSASDETLYDLNENNDASAINALNAFINAVKAQIGGQITEADGDELIRAAGEIIVTIGN